MPGVNNKLTLAQAAKLTPGKPHASTLFRWATKGQRGVRLEVWNYGRRLFTTVEAIESFARAVARAPADRRAARTRSRPRPGQRGSQIDRAKREAQRQGIAG